DFGNENVELVQSIANLEIAKAVILGNHDCWNTQQFSGKRKDRVQLQLECLGEEHVGYCRLDFPSLKLTVVGGRPFSHGGATMFRKRLLSARYGVHDMEGSAKRIYNSAIRTPDGHSVIFLAHNGPTGLGSKVNDICGKDWDFGGGDHGDPDLAKAISELKETTQIAIPLVVFGHMHKELAYGKGARKMIVVGEDNTVYLNGAIVPRVKRPIREQETSTSMKESQSVCSPETNGTVRAFTLVEILDGKLQKIIETWIFVMGDETRLEEQHILFQTVT
ncbi:Calcineurin-like metallo-phosphoesterase superfamily protein, partial [Thalictrum thalictroides]